MGKDKRKFLVDKVRRGLIAAACKLQGYIFLQIRAEGVSTSLGVGVEPAGIRSTGAEEQSSDLPQTRNTGPVRKGLPRCSVPILLCTHSRASTSQPAWHSHLSFQSGSGTGAFSLHRSGILWKKDQFP